jgi:hypothetical protein
VSGPDWGAVAWSGVFVALAFGAGRVYQWRRTFPYRWRCREPGCEFRLGTNNREQFEEARSTHVWTHVETSGQG